MSMRVLLDGELHGTPVQRTGSSGKPFTTAKLIVKQQDGESLFASLIAFEATAAARLAGLNEGAALAVSGRAILKTYAGKDGQPRAGLDVVADEVAALPRPKRERKAKPQPAGQPAGSGFTDDPLDDLDWGAA